MTRISSGGRASRRRLAVLCALVAVLATGVSGGVLGFDESAESGPEAIEQANVQGDHASPFAGPRNLSSADASFVGEAANDTAGWSSATGDVNGDGVSDLIVGAPRNDSTGSNAGAVYVFYGPTDSGAASLADADARLVGESAGDWAGWSLAAGDLDGDGTDEVVVGAPRADANGSNAGATYVVNGSTIENGTTSLSEAEAKLIGRGSGDHAGWAVDVMANLTADGTAGVVVGAPYANTSAPDAGAAFLVSAASLSGIVNLTDATATFYGAGGGDLAGWDVSSGDVNGDGLGDVLIGAPRNDTAGNDSGAAYLVYGERFGVSILDSADLTVVGDGEGDLAGYSLAGGADVNGDAVADPIVGAPLNDSSGENAGAVGVIYGAAELGGTVSLTDGDRLLVGEGAGDRAGWSVAAVPGERSCDGVGDVLVGAPYNDSIVQDVGAAYVVAGDDSAGGWQSLGEANAKFSGAGPGDQAGRWVASADDANGDGVGDVLVGAPYNDTAGTDAGIAYLAYGQCPEPDTTTATPPGTETPAKTPTATPGPIGTPTKTETEVATTRPETATPEPRTTAPADVEVTFLDCDAVEVTGEYSAVRLVVVGGPPQVFDAVDGPTFYTEGGETIAVVQVFGPDGELVVVAPRPGGVGQCVSQGAPGNPGDDPFGDDHREYDR